MIKTHKNVLKVICQLYDLVSNNNVRDIHVTPVLMY